MGVRSSLWRTKDSANLIDWGRWFQKVFLLPLSLCFWIFLNHTHPLVSLPPSFQFSLSLSLCGSCSLSLHCSPSLPPSFSTSLPPLHPLSCSHAQLVDHGINTARVRRVRFPLGPPKHITHALKKIDSLETISNHMAHLALSSYLDIWTTWLKMARLADKAPSHSTAHLY